MKLYHNDMVKLKEMFGHRALFDASELRLYSQDVSNPPAPVKMMIRTMPQAVVLPKDTDELVRLVKFANQKHVPLVPRGGGSAGYGGAMPVKGGIVVDMSLFTDPVKVHGNGKLATIAAGMTFIDADAALKRHGKALRIMPTSAPMATLGGWAAQGGAGIGSLRYGWVHDVVQALEVVLPNGDIRTFADSELDVFLDMEGTTGLITKVTVKVRDDVELIPVVGTFKDLAGLQKAVNAVRATGQVHTAIVHNPEFNDLRQEATGDKNIPKGQWSLVLALEKGIADKTTIEAIVTDAEGKVLPTPKAAAEWDQRFALFRAKRLGPSMVPGESVVPTARLAESAAMIRRAVKADELNMEGIIAGDETIWFCYTLDDERRAQYPGAFGAAVAVLAASKKVGGRTLGTGVYLSTEARHVFDQNRVDRYHKFRASVDTHHIMNPGKVFGTPLRFKPDWAPGPNVAQALAPGNPLLRMAHGSPFVKYTRSARGRPAFTAGLSAALGAGSGGSFGRKWAWELIAGDIDKSIRWSSASARAFHSLGASPSGWATWAKDHAVSGKTVTAHQWAMLQGEGLAAGADLASTLALPWSRIFQDLKAHLVEQGFRPLKSQRDMAAAYVKHNNVYGAPHDERSRWAEGLDLPAKGPTLLFVDDHVAYRRPQVAKDAVALLEKAGTKVAHLGADERGSGAVLFHTGQGDKARDHAIANIKAIVATGAKTVIVTDAAALHVLAHDYAALAAEEGLAWTVNVQHVSTVLADALAKGSLEAPSYQGPVTVHDVPVLLINGDDGRDLRKAAGTVMEMVHHGKLAYDLGTTGAVPECFPEVTSTAAQDRIREALDIGAAVMVSPCPMSTELLEDAAHALDGETEVPVPQVVDLTAWLIGSAQGGTAPAAEAEAIEDDVEAQTTV